MSYRSPVFRTTVEIREEQRAALVALAARRGIRGFSLLVQEAVDRYLASQMESDRKVRDALRQRGAFAGRDGDRSAAQARRAHRTWGRGWDP